MNVTSTAPTQVSTIYDDIEVDDQELDEARTDSGGILSLDFTRSIAKTGVRVFISPFTKGSD